jgi:hypothetical protein
MANNPPNPGAGGAGNLQPAFALSPALASDDIIDYTSAHGAKLYKSAIESLQTDLFDCDAQGITGFLNALEDRAMRSGWSGIINIPQDMTNPVADTVNLITNFGEISTDKILAHAQSYVATPTTSESRFCSVANLCAYFIVKFVLNKQKMCLSIYIRVL